MSAAEIWHIIRQWIIHTTLLSLVSLTLTGCNERTLPQSTPSLDEKQKEDLVNQIVNRWTGGVKNSFVVRVEVGNEDPTFPLKVNKDMIRQCWYTQSSRVGNCEAESMLDAFKQEGTVPWKNSYFAFAVVSVNKDYTKATVRLDTTFGPQAAASYMVTFVRENGFWREESRRTLRIS